jgi:hypothetical protein
MLKMSYLGSKIADEHYSRSYAKVFLLPNTQQAECLCCSYLFRVPLLWTIFILGPKEEHVERCLLHCSLECTRCTMYAWSHMSQSKELRVFTAYRRCFKLKIWLVLKREWGGGICVMITASHGDMLFKILGVCACAHP